jgi:multidrug efflux pump subunit AcrB
MAELPITYSKRQHTPGLDGTRWHVGLDFDGDQAQLVVEVSRTAAKQTGLSASELDARLEDALQRYAAETLANDRRVLDQVVGWNSPIVLRPEDFTRA